MSKKKDKKKKKEKEKRKGIIFKLDPTMPRASDYKLPKKLSKKQKRMIKTTRVILKGFKKAREKRAEAERLEIASRRPFSDMFSRMLDV